VSCAFSCAAQPLVDAITQKVYPVAKEKNRINIKLITEGNWQQILVFTRTSKVLISCVSHD
jgi:hypothetical protein